MKSLCIGNKNYNLPVYLPDATRAVTKSIDSIDLKNANVKGVVINTYHLISDPGAKILKKFGGVKNYMNFDGFAVSDSGGWQLFSLIHRNNTKGKITDEGVTFSLGAAAGKIFTPKDSIKAQFDIGSDIVICLDDFTPPDASFAQAKETIRRNVLWAKACKKEYDRQVAKKGNKKPLILGVVQGGYFKDLRKQCLEELMEIDFDGYGYGGYAVDDNGNLDLELSRYLAKLIPDNKIKFALGVGRPIDVVKLSKMGWDIFDCTLPTRDARHNRLYIFTKDPYIDKFKSEDEIFDHIYINKKKYETDSGPISKFCDCHVCKNFSRSYLRHLLKIKDLSFYRLASIHNIRIYTIITEILQTLR